MGRPIIIDCVCTCYIVSTNKHIPILHIQVACLLSNIDYPKTNLHLPFPKCILCSEEGDFGVSVRVMDQSLSVMQDTLSHDHYSCVLSLTVHSLHHG